jgi:hypothetical protein
MIAAVKRINERIGINTHVAAKSYACGRKKFALSHCFQLAKNGETP